MTNSSRKISNFLSKTAVSSGSYFTFIYNGQNYKISDSDFYSSLGVTGTIEQEGDPLATPVLNIDSTTYKIRNIETGGGIKAQVSPNGGVLIENNFSQDSMGEPIVSGLDEDSPVFASLMAGDGINITKEDDVITFEATGEFFETKTVTVNEPEDFGEISGGLYDLDAGTTYVVANDVEISSGLDLKEGTAVVGNSYVGPLLTFTGSGALFNATDSTVLIKDLHYTCPNGSQFDISDTTGNTKICNVVNTQCEESVDFGTFDSLFALNMFNSNCLSNTDTGPVFEGSGWTLIAIDRLGLFTESASYVGIDLGAAVSDGIEINDLYASGPSGAIAIKAAANSANITSGNIGTITKANFAGDITPVSGFAPTDDIRWDVLGNDSIENTRTDALMSIQSNATATSIAVAGTPVKMAGTWTDQGSSAFTIDTNGRMTYIGERKARLPIDITVSMLMDSGGDKEVSAYIAINGTVVAATKKTGTASSSNPASITLVWQHEFENSDYVEIFLANETGTTDVIGQNAVGRIN